MSLLDIRDLTVTYRTRRGEQHTAVEGVVENASMPQL